ncbi:MAG: hypothetical protein LBR53_02885 [Deltaproteobacteria bacterium]|nr:hypothetical protein [Deltaproteobacteria bacterium]
MEKFMALPRLYGLEDVLARAIPNFFKALGGGEVKNIGDFPCPAFSVDTLSAMSRVHEALSSFKTHMAADILPPDLTLYFLIAARALKNEGLIKRILG